jgi:hypothetical protein
MNNKPKYAADKMAALEKRFEVYTGAGVSYLREFARQVFLRCPALPVPTVREDYRTLRLTWESKEASLMVTYYYHRTSLVQVSSTCCNPRENRVYSTDADDEDSHERLVDALMDIYRDSSVSFQD